MESMMQDVAENREWVSALADGQLRGDEFARTVEWVEQTEDARITWHAYHLVGDVLRSGETLLGAHDPDFLHALRLRLQQEAPQVLHATQANDVNVPADDLDRTATSLAASTKMRSANDSRFGWKLLVGLASLSTVAVIAWQTSGGGRDLSGAPQVAQMSVQMLRPPEAGLTPLGADGEPQRMIRDPQLDALLAAHQQFGGTSALQGPAGFLRNATFDRVGP